MGVGYGIGIYDFDLVKKSLLNLGIATLISLLTSTLYFVISPLTEAQSELMARTTPTIWDVLIALFGGLAGIVGATRREKSNVIPGVAIATALMPPLCTAGYGLANANWHFFFGAIYLFSINSVFIAVGTLIIIDLLRMPHRKFVDSHIEERVKRWIFAIVMLTTLPSLYLAYRLVQDEIFNNNARQFLAKQFRFEKSHVVASTFDPSTRRIELTLLGEPIQQSRLHDIESRLDMAGLTGASIVVHQPESKQLDVTTLKQGIINELFRDSQLELRERAQKINQLEAELALGTRWRNDAEDIAAELRAQIPNLGEIIVGTGIEPAKDKSRNAHQIAILSLKSSKPLTPAERQRIEAWFRVRTKSDAIRLIVEMSEYTPVKRKN